MTNNKNIKNIINCTAVVFHKLNIIGYKKVNSTSYKIKNTHNNVKFILICIFISVSELNPHS